MNSTERRTPILETLSQSGLPYSEIVQSGDGSSLANAIRRFYDASCTLNPYMDWDCIREGAKRKVGNFVQLELVDNDEHVHIMPITANWLFLPVFQRDMRDESNVYS